MARVSQRSVDKGKLGLQGPPRTLGGRNSYLVGGNYRETQYATVHEIVGHQADLMIIIIVTLAL